jgi:putative transposase
VRKECADSARVAEELPPSVYRRCMGRPLRIEEPGLHHVVTRGNNKQPIFVDDRDRTLFCLTVARVVRRYDWRVLAYVLMRNHYHLLLAVGDLGLSRGMHDLNLAHACQFNVRHSRINHLFGKRYWNRYLQTEVSVRNVARYIVQNPRRAGSSEPLDAHPWSSYAPTVGRAFARIPLALDELLPYFGGTPAHAVAEYEEFCAVMADPDELEETRPVPGTRTSYAT